ncbi:MAG: SurA N-terminal domain-containing protein [Pseudomonadota bacterium]|nr:SurA N-terminal domain-containing protein [Pseudomonadota bacterium]
MSVLENLRKGTDSTGTRLLIGVVVAVFIFWGVGQNGNDKTYIYASVNGQTITDSDFRRAYSQQARQAGRNLTEDEEKDLGNRVLTSLVEEEALVQEADRLGISVSEEEVAREVVKIPSFAGSDGKFDEKTYLRLLKSNGMSRGQFELSVRRGLLVQKLADFASRSVALSAAELQAEYLKQETTLELAFVRLPTSAFLDDVVVSDADRDAFLTQNADRVKARYDESYDRFYNLPKRYQLRTILLRTDLPGTEPAAVQARAEAVRAEARAGADFAELAKRWSEDLSASTGGLLGLQALDQIDAALVAAADAAGVGNVSQVTQTSRGLQILFVEKIEDAKITTLDEAKPEIAVAMLKEERAPALAEAFAARLIEAWQANGAAPTELLAEKHLAADTTGTFSLADPEVPRLGNDATLRQQIEKAPAGYVVPVPLKLKDTVFVVSVASRTEADPARFEEARTMLEGRLLAQRRSEFLEQWRSDVVATATIERNETFGAK